MFHMVLGTDNSPFVIALPRNESARIMKLEQDSDMLKLERDNLFDKLEIIKRNTDEVVKYKAVVTSVKATDTVKIADDDGFVISTPERKSVYFMQTPQTFEYKLALDSYSALIKDLEKEVKVQVTDDAQVVEMYSDTRVKLIEGDYSNIKITVPKDLQ